MADTRPRLLLVGWDAADWKVISPLMDEGKMPVLQRLVERGVMGNLATLDPPFSPLLWTSIATGHTADRHGVLHFAQPNANGRGARPVMGSSRKVKAVWDVLGERGFRSNVVGWWPSHPAEPIRGAMVSDLFHTAPPSPGAPWPLPAGSVSPPELSDVVAELRVHPAEITAAHLLPFVPRLADVDQRADRRFVALTKILAHAASVQAVATYLMDETEWDLTAVYFDAIDHFGHGFMKYRPPRHGRVSERDVELYGGVTEAAYRFHDMMLGHLIERAGPDAHVLVLSDHGFHSDHLRPTAIPKIPAGPAVEHRSFGIIALAGPGVRRDERIHGAGLLNIAPTVLTLFGLPVGEDMAAPPLLQALEEDTPVRTVPSWEETAPTRSEATPPVDPWAEAEAMNQLVELGYIEPASDDPARAAANAAQQAAFNLGRVYASTGRPELALEAFEKAYADATEAKEYCGLWLVHAYLRVERAADADALARSLAEEHPGLGARVALLRADAQLQLGDAAAALDALDAAAESGHPEVRLRRATALLHLERFPDAQDAFEAVLALDPDNARAWHGVAQAAIGQKLYQRAADAAMEAVGRLFYFPDAHFHLGVAMLRLGWAERAEQAFRVAIQQRPKHRLSHRWLARTYADYLQRPDDARRHLSIAERLGRPVAPPVADG